MPMDEASLGGFAVHDPAVRMPPTPPPKNLPGNGYPSTIPMPVPEPLSDTIAHVSRMSAVERSNAFRVARTNPHLQFMAGPLLHYDTVDHLGVWHGHVLIVSTCGLDFSPSSIVTKLIHYAATDAGSIYEPHPILTYEWDPEHTDDHRRERTTTSTSFDLGPHPADPHSITSAALNSQFRRGPFSERQQVPGHEIWVYAGRGGYVIAYRITYSASECCSKIL